MNSEKSQKILQTEVETGTDGLPTGWRLLKSGVNILTQNGEAVTLTLSEKHLQQVTDYYHSKSAKIPLDADHFLHHLAMHNGLDEGALVAAAPYKGGLGTLGYGALELRGDALWVAQIDWVPSAKTLLNEKQYRYSSPVLQGIDGKSPLRVTSVAMTNSPALSDTPSLLAMSELVYTPQPNPKPKEQPMPENEDKDKNKKECIAASDTPPGGGAETTVESLTAELNALKEENKRLKEALEAAGGELALTDLTPEGIKKVLVPLKAKADSHEALTARIKTLEMSENSRKLDDLIAKGRREGRITDGNEAILRSKGFIALSEFYPALPVVVPMGGIGPAQTPSGALALTDSEKL